MFNFFKRKSKESRKYTDEAREYYTASLKLFDIMATTTDPTRFFSLYSKMLDLISLIYNMNPDDQLLIDVQTLHNKLLDCNVTNDFFNRCCDENLLYSNRDLIITYKNLIPNESYQYFLHLTGIDLETYRYCSVTFDGSRSYSYICEFDEVYPGNLVVVPVGDDNEEKIATVVDSSIYRYDEVPYPLHRTKKSNFKDW